MRLARLLGSACKAEGQRLTLLRGTEVPETGGHW